MEDNNNNEDNNQKTLNKRYKTLSALPLSFTEKPTESLGKSQLLQEKLRKILQERDINKYKYKKLDIPDNLKYDSDFSDSSNKEKTNTKINIKNENNENIPIRESKNKTANSSIYDENKSKTIDEKNKIKNNENNQEDENKKLYQLLLSKKLKKKENKEINIKKQEIPEKIEKSENKNNIKLDPPNQKIEINESGMKILELLKAKKNEKNKMDEKLKKTQDNINLQSNPVITNFSKTFDKKKISKNIINLVSNNNIINEKNENSENNENNDSNENKNNEIKENNDINNKNNKKNEQAPKVYIKFKSIKKESKIYENKIKNINDTNNIKTKTDNKETLSKPDSTNNSATKNTCEEKKCQEENDLKDTKYIKINKNLEKDFLTLNELNNTLNANINIYKDDIKSENRNISSKKKNSPIVCNIVNSPPRNMAYKKPKPTPKNSNSVLNNLQIYAPKKMSKGSSQDKIKGRIDGENLYMTKNYNKNTINYNKNTINSPKRQTYMKKKSNPVNLIANKSLSEVPNLNKIGSNKKMLNSSFNTNYELIRKNSNSNYRLHRKISNISPKITNYSKDTPHFHKANIFLSPLKAKNIFSEDAHNNYFYSSTNQNIYNKKEKRTNKVNYIYNSHINQFKLKNCPNNYIHRKNISVYSNQSSIIKTNLLQNEDLLIIEDKLTDIMISLNQGNLIYNECFEFWNFFYNSSLSENLEKILSNTDKENSAIIKLSLNYCLMSILTSYDTSFNEEKLNKISPLLLEMLELCHKLLILIMESLLLETQKQEKNSVSDNFWLSKLYHIITCSKLSDDTSFLNINKLTEKEKMKYYTNFLMQKINYILNNYPSEKPECYLLFKKINIKNLKEINIFFRSFILREKDIKFSVLGSSFLKQAEMFEPATAPYMTFKPTKNYTLVLDIDETLFHFKLNALQSDEGYLKIRPGVFKFLEEIKKFYEIIFFTEADKSYGELIAQAIIENCNCFDYIFYRENTNIINNDFVKDLSKLGRNLDRTIIIDNMPQNFRLQKENGIYIKSFWGEDNNDVALFDLIPILKNIAISGDDVRTGLKKYNEEIVTKINSNICRHNS